MKALGHLSAEVLGDREQAHALVVRHERPHDGAPLPVGHPPRGVVDGLEEPVVALEALGDEAPEVLYRRGGVHQQGERSGVGSDHEVVAEAALDPEAGHAEGAVLVVELQVAGVVGALGDAPGDVRLLAVGHLALDDHLAGLVEQRVAVAAHEQRRHQVLEHRARP